MTPEVNKAPIDPNWPPFKTHPNYSPGTPEFDGHPPFVSIGEEEYEQILEWKKKAEELQATFDLRWKADMRARKMWQEATGEELTWPDHADLVVFLLEKLEKAEKLINEIKEITESTKCCEVKEK